MRFYTCEFNASLLEILQQQEAHIQEHKAIGLIIFLRVSWMSLCVTAVALNLCAKPQAPVMNNIFKWCREILLVQGGHVSAGLMFATCWPRCSSSGCVLLPCSWCKTNLI